MLRLGYWREAAAFPEIPPHCAHDLCETLRTVGVREGGIVQIRAMCLSIRPRRDPALTIRGRYGLVSNEIADTTDGEQRRCDERLSHRSGRRLTSCLSKQFYKSHTPPFSCSIYPPDREQQRGDVLSLVSNLYDEYTNPRPFEELGNLLVPREQVTSVKY